MMFKKIAGLLVFVIVLISGCNSSLSGNLAQNSSRNKGIINLSIPTVNIPLNNTQTLQISIANAQSLIFPESVYLSASNDGISLSNNFCIITSINGSCSINITGESISSNIALTVSGEGLDPSSIILSVVNSSISYIELTPSQVNLVQGESTSLSATILDNTNLTYPQVITFVNNSNLHLSQDSCIINYKNEKCSVSIIASQVSNANIVSAYIKSSNVLSSSSSINIYSNNLNSIRLTPNHGTNLLINESYILNVGLNSNNALVYPLTIILQSPKNLNLSNYSCNLTSSTDTCDIGVTPNEIGQNIIVSAYGTTYNCVGNSCPFLIPKTSLNFNIVQGNVLHLTTNKTSLAMLGESLLVSATINQSQVVNFPVIIKFSPNAHLIYKNNFCVISSANESCSIVAINNYMSSINTSTPIIAYESQVLSGEVSVAVLQNIGLNNYSNLTIFNYNNLYARYQDLSNNWYTYSCNNNLLSCNSITKQSYSQLYKLSESSVITYSGYYSICNSELNVCNRSDLLNNNIIGDNTKLSVFTESIIYGIANTNNSSNLLKCNLAQNNCITLSNNVPANANLEVFNESYVFVSSDANYVQTCNDLGCNYAKIFNESVLSVALFDQNHFYAVANYFNQLRLYICNDSLSNCSPSINPTIVKNIKTITNFNPIKISDNNILIKLTSGNYICNSALAYNSQCINIPQFNGGSYVSALDESHVYYTYNPYGSTVINLVNY